MSWMYIFFGMPNLLHPYALLSQIKLLYSPEPTCMVKQIVRCQCRGQPNTMAIQTNLPQNRSTKKMPCTALGNSKPDLIRIFVHANLQLQLSAAKRTCVVPVLSQAFWKTTWSFLRSEPLNMLKVESYNIQHSLHQRGHVKIIVSNNDTVTPSGPSLPFFLNSWDLSKIHLAYLLRPSGNGFGIWMCQFLLASCGKYLYSISWYSSPANSLALGSQTSVRPKRDLPVKTLLYVEGMHIVYSPFLLVSGSHMYLACLAPMRAKKR